MLFSLQVEAAMESKRFKTSITELGFALARCGLCVLSAHGIREDCLLHFKPAETDEARLRLQLEKRSAWNKA